MPSTAEPRKPRPEINVSKIVFGGGIAGLIFAATAFLIFLTGVPAARWLLAASVPAGLLVALILRLTSRD